MRRGAAGARDAGGDRAGREAAVGLVAGRDPRSAWRRCRTTFRRRSRWPATGHPSTGRTVPWVELPGDTKRAADAAVFARKLAPPRVTLKLEEADEGVLDAAREEMGAPRHSSRRWRSTRPARLRPPRLLSHPGSRSARSGSTPGRPSYPRFRPSPRATEHDLTRERPRIAPPPPARRSRERSHQRGPVRLRRQPPLGALRPAAAAPARLRGSLLEERPAVERRAGPRATSTAGRRARGPRGRRPPPALAVIRVASARRRSGPGVVEHGDGAARWRPPARPAPGRGRRRVGCARGRAPRAPRPSSRRSLSTPPGTSSGPQVKARPRSRSTEASRHSSARARGPAENVTRALPL